MGYLHGERPLDEELMTKPKQQKKSKKNAASPAKKKVTLTPTAGQVLAGPRVQRQKVVDEHVWLTPPGSVKIQCSACLHHQAVSAVYTHPDAPGGRLCPRCFEGGRRLAKG